MARKEEPPAALAIRTPGVDPFAPAGPAAPQGTETGVAVASATGNAGPASLGAASGSGGSSGGGNGTGSGGGGGSGSGNGPGIGAGFGTPGGPRFLHRAVPEYPFLARRRKKEGSVLLMVFIDDAGKLIKTEVVETSDQMFVGPSLDAVKKSTFLPAERDGRPVACKALLPIRFSLTE
jgi:protein TonB